MARKPRLEFAGALYHVISRGNYRKPIFAQGGGAAFEKTLFEACAKCGWRLHAYVIMSNHYHLALETPQPNLVEGMRWLQGTFGIRFNAWRRERGHVFQSRYKSLVIEEGRPLLGLVNYIHLNPVRAGLVKVGRLREHALSSFPKFFARKVPAGLVRSRFLAALEFPDTPSGMRRYAEHLEFSEENDPSAREELSRRYCRGWAVASEEFRAELKKAYAEMDEPAGWAGAEVAELREAKWEGLLTRLLRSAGKTRKDAREDRKSAPWKVRIARELRATSTAPNAWIARHLAMGHPTRVCNLIRKKM
jgi:REP element-mobilizing transposase RayT